MEQKTYFNLKTIQSIHVINRQYHGEIVIIPARKKWFIFGENKPERYQAGYYGGDVYNSIEELIDNSIYIIEKMKVYKKPYVKLFYQNKTENMCRFNTFESALAWGKEVALASPDVLFEVK